VAVKWTYDPTANQYSYPSGRKVPLRELVRVRDGFAAARQTMLRELGEQLASGKIGLPEWEVQFRAIVSETISALHMFGAGGEQMLAQNPMHIVRLRMALNEQMPFSSRFVSQIYTGEVSPEAVAARSEQYVGAGIKAYEQARADNWGITLPYYPADHLTECHGNCRCSWSITTTTDATTGNDVTKAWWQTEGDDKVCADCRRRGADYPAPGVVIA
jgi:hypothetical protein